MLQTWLNLSYAEKHGYGNFANVLVSDIDIGQHRSECVKVRTQQEKKKYQFFYFGHGSAIVNTKKMNKNEWENRRMNENDAHLCLDYNQTKQDSKNYKNEWEIRGTDITHTEKGNIYYSHGHTSQKRQQILHSATL